MMMVVLTMVLAMMLLVVLPGFLLTLLNVFHGKACHTGKGQGGQKEPPHGRRIKWTAMKRIEQE